MLGEAGCLGPVLLSALDLLQQPLPGQKGKSGNTTHLDSPPAGASRASGGRPAPPRGGKGSARNCLSPSVIHRGLCSGHFTPPHAHLATLFIPQASAWVSVPSRLLAPTPMHIPQWAPPALWLLHQSTYQHHGLGCTGLRLRLWAA